jgi:hypothetical protein
MDTATPSPRRLDDLPLWRLLVALDDAERSLGPDASTTRTLASAIQRRLRRERPAPRRPPAGQEAQP